ncbi:MAG: mechanosensitive ion channel family protein [Saprospiraceae bacterium]
METKDYLDRAIDAAWNYGPNVLLAAVILFVGLWVIRRFANGFNSFLKARDVDESLRPFFTSLVDTGMKVVLLLVVAGRLGIETTSFIAIFSAVAFAVGLALQGSLGNFASGVLVLLFRPYRVGDQVNAAGHEGDVAEIQIFNTVLVTSQGKRIIVPNAKMTEGAIERIGKTDEIRRDVAVVVKDTTSIALLRPVAEEVARKCPYRLPNTEPFVQITGFPAGGMKVEIGCWTTGKDYDDTFYFLHEDLKKAFDTVGIELADNPLNAIRR